MGGATGIAELGIGRPPLGDARGVLAVSFNEVARSALDIFRHAGTLSPDGGKRININFVPGIAAAKRR
jgi:hypothetical protein